MRFKLDENLGRAAAEALARVGHDVATVQGQKLSGAADGALILKCRREARCLVTLDLEFGNPLLYKPSDYAGIVVLRLPPQPTLQALLDAVDTLAAALAGGRGVNGKLWVVQRGRVRQYEPDQ